VDADEAIVSVGHKITAIRLEFARELRVEVEILA